MKGKILEYSIQNSNGVISGDDGKRYNFNSSKWININDSFNANYILRFLLKDNLEMYDISKEYVVNNNCTISSEVLAEVVFVLLKVYKVEKEDI
ncbi:MAG: hypothetical protein U9R16_05300 [Campylobacterota bacterium]|nr:hypothetical protein [Campylobacterota bacterium]